MHGAYIVSTRLLQGSLKNTNSLILQKKNAAKAWGRLSCSVIALLRTPIATCDNLAVILSRWHSMHVAAVRENTARDTLTGSDHNHSTSY